MHFGRVSESDLFVRIERRTESRRTQEATFTDKYRSREIEIKFFTYPFTDYPLSSHMS